MRFLIVLTLLAIAAAVRAEDGHRCSMDAVARAKALLLFHTGTTERVSVEDSVKVLPPLRNPVDPRQYFDVLEVHGYVYRAAYRMRLIYARIPGTCVLMGQEILERSSV